MASMRTSMGTRVERYFVDSARLVMIVICQIIQVRVDECKKVTLTRNSRHAYHHTVIWVRV